MARRTQPMDPTGTNMKKLGGRFVIQPKQTKQPVQPTDGEWKSRRQRIFENDSECVEVAAAPPPKKKTTKPKDVPKPPSRKPVTTNGVRAADKAPPQKKTTTKTTPKTRPATGTKSRNGTKRQKNDDNDDDARRSRRVHKRPNYNEDSDVDDCDGFVVSDNDARSEEGVYDDYDDDDEDDSNTGAEEDNEAYLNDIMSGDEEVIQTAPRSSPPPRSRNKNGTRTKPRASPFTEAQRTRVGKRKRADDSGDEGRTTKRARRSARRSASGSKSSSIQPDKKRADAVPAPSCDEGGDNNNDDADDEVSNVMATLPFVVSRPGGDSTGAKKIGSLYHRIMKTYPSETAWRKGLTESVVGQDWAMSHLASILSTVPMCVASKNAKPCVLLLSGTAGSGKTTAIRKIVRMLGVENTVAHIQRSGTQFVDETTTANVIGAADGLAKCDSEAALMPCIIKGADYSAKNGTLVVLEIDEAHLMHGDVWGSLMGLLGEGQATSGVHGHKPVRVSNLLVLLAANWGEPQISKRYLAAAAATHTRAGEERDGEEVIFFGDDAQDETCVEKHEEANALDDIESDSDNHSQYADIRAAILSPAADAKEANGTTAHKASKTAVTYPTPSEMLAYVEHDMVTKRDRHDKRPLITAMQRGRIDHILPIGPIQADQVIVAVRRDMEREIKERGAVTGFYIHLRDDKIAEFLSLRLSITDGFRRIHSTVIALVARCINEAFEHLHSASPLFVTLDDATTKTASTDRVHVCMTVGAYRDAYRHAWKVCNGTVDITFPAYNFSVAIPLT